MTMQISESSLRAFFLSILQGESSLREKENSLNKQSVNTYKFPISIFVQELRNTIEDAPEYALEYSGLMIDELIRDIKLNYTEYIKLI